MRQPRLREGRICFSRRRRLFQARVVGLDVNLQQPFLDCLDNYFEATNGPHGIPGQRATVCNTAACFCVLVLISDQMHRIAVSDRFVSTGPPLRMCTGFPVRTTPPALLLASSHTPVYFFFLQARELRRQEGMDPPIPTNVLRTLDAAEGDLRLLCFKYAALAVAVAQRPQPTPDETGEGDGGGGGNRDADGAEGAGGSGETEGGLSEDDLLGLLEQHVSPAYVSRVWK